MTIKVFKAADLKEAMAMVKDELGSDAVILNTKRYREGGFLGLNSKEIVEVTAAIDDEPRTKPRQRTTRTTRKKAPSSMITPTPSKPTAQYGDFPEESEKTTAPVRRVKQPIGATRRKTADGSVRRRLPQVATYAEPNLLPGDKRDIPSVLAPTRPVVRPERPENSVTGIQIQEKPTVRKRPAPRHRVVSIPIEDLNNDEALAAIAQGVKVKVPVRAVKKKSAPPPPVFTDESLAAALSGQPIAPVSQETYELHVENSESPVLVDKEVQPAVENPPQEPVMPEVNAQVKENTESGEKNTKILALEKELAEMRAQLQQIMGDGGTSEPEVETLKDRLMEHDVAESVIDDMTARLSEESLKVEGASEDALLILAGYLKNRVGFASGIELKPGHPKIVALIGTTGVGKTTTLAKIAARFVLEKGVSAAMITADTYRISAVEQLKTYSDIIGLPLEIVYSPAELKTAIRKFRDKQLILIDTAGRSQNNEFQMSELIEFLKVEPSIEKHLVLSSTTKSRDLEMILDKFAPCNPDRLIFTKLDETNSRGLILNLLLKRSLPISYLTNGQSVPDDIVPADAEQLSKILLE